MSYVTTWGVLLSLDMLTIGGFTQPVLWPAHNSFSSVKLPNFTRWLGFFVLSQVTL